MNVSLPSLVALAMAAAVASGCYCSHGRVDPLDAAAEDAGVADAVAPDAATDGGPDASALACDEAVDALAEAARLDVLGDAVGFEPAVALGEEHVATVVTVEAGRLWLDLDSGEFLSFRWPSDEPFRWFSEGEDVVVGVRDGWHYVESAGFSGSFAFVQAFDGPVPGPIAAPIPDIEMVFAPRCLRPIAECGGADQARQFLLGVGREVYRRWVPPDGHDNTGPSYTDVWHVGSIEAPLACGAEPRFHAVIAVAGEIICIC